MIFFAQIRQSPAVSLAQDSATFCHFCHSFVFGILFVYSFIEINTNMAKKLCREKYTIRTLSFYQEQGGIFNDLITHLTKLRLKPQHRGMPSPASLLNEACFVLDSSKLMPEEDAAKYIAKQPEIIQNLVRRMQEGQKQAQAAMTLQAIINYILEHKQYQFVNQIINMLKDLIGRTCSDEEYQQILAAEKAVMANTPVQIINKNEMHGCNVFPGMVNNPKFPRQ